MTIKRVSRLALVFLLLVAGCAGRAGNSEFDRVKRVVDGDTMILEGLGRVRLIGVDTPESVRPDHPVEYFGREAADFAQRTIEGKRVRVEFGEERFDNHDRTLVYLYSPEDALFNATLIQQGYAIAYTQYPFTRRDEFLRLEHEARTSGRGMWAKIAGRWPLEFHGNVNSMIYHGSQCEHFNCSNCTRGFSSRLDAEEAGFRPHWGCMQPK
ncbi:MAG: thermonuclease family protein [Acidobacteriota bacterium]|nr:MAG: thermonuclease family protein [Acidobacteriota bacterium]